MGVMPSVQRFLSGHNNLARAATVVASSVRASTAIERVAALRAGGGRVRLDGSYTGHEAAEIELELLAPAGAPPRASAVQFTGVGNGTLTVAAVDAGAPLQTLTLTLADLGIATTHAGLDVREVRLRAKVAGSAGNQVRVTVVPQLVRAASDWALLADWSPGQATQTGEQWDFGALALSPRDELDAASPRIQFGFDPQVYRPWRRLTPAGWEFGLSPALERAVAKGTPVFKVTGGYLVTVTDGATTETFGDVGAAQPEVVTFHDLLVQLAGSTLVEVAGVVVRDRAIGGQAAIDVPLRTSAWLRALGGAVALQDVQVPAGAPTQSVTVRCINADTVGAERWQVAGDVSGAMGVAQTGLPFAHAAIGFTVPARAALASTSGDWSFTTTWAPRDDDEGVPSICLRPFRLGVNAAPRTVTFRYQKRPPAECSCGSVPAPRLSLRCLGVQGGDAMALDVEYQSRLEALYDWRSDMLKANTDLAAPTRYRRMDMDLVDAASRAFAEALAEVYEVAAARSEWDDALDELQADVAWLSGIDGGDGRYGLVQLGALWHAIGQWYEVTEVKRDGTVLGAAVAWTAPSGPTYGLPSRFDPVWDVALGADVTLTFDLTGHTGGAPELGYSWAVKLTRVAPPASPAPGDLPGGLGDAAHVEREQQLVRRYLARMDYVRALAGVVPKSDPSSSDAGGCWVDHGDAFWWVDTDGKYLPAFTNHAYISARRDADTGKPYSTMEFGFGLVVACAGRLKEGDTITLRIDRVDGARPYSVGDEAALQTVGAGAAWLTGGVDGTDELTWRVVGSVSGALPDLVAPTDGTPAPPYTAAGVTLQMALGGIAFALGDRFALAVEASQFRWRRAGQAWSAPTDVPAAGPAALADGLLAHFDVGAAPSFEPGDAYTFAVHQPWAASHVQDGQATAWGWAGAAATLTIDLGSAQPLGALALARYELPAGAAVSAELSADGVTWGAPLALTLGGPVALRFVDAVARHVRLSVSGAAGGRIGWVWIGQPLATTHHASACERRRRWALRHGEGVNPASLYAGRGDGWSLEWSPGAGNASRLTEVDVQALVALLDHAQQAGEPLIFVPHHGHPQDAALVRFAEDALAVTDLHAWQPDAAAARIMSATLALDPVFA